MGCTRPFALDGEAPTLKGALPWPARAGQFRLTKSKSSALLVWFDPASPAFSIETLNAPYRDLSINSNLVPQDDNPKLDFQADKPAEGFIAGIQGAGHQCVGRAHVCAASLTDCPDALAPQETSTATTFWTAALPTMCLWARCVCLCIHGASAHRRGRAPKISRKGASSGLGAGTLIV